MIEGENAGFLKGWRAAAFFFIGRSHGLVGKETTIFFVWQRWMSGGGMGRLTSLGAEVVEDFSVRLRGAVVMMGNNVFLSATEGCGEIFFGMEEDNAFL